MISNFTCSLTIGLPQAQADFKAKRTKIQIRLEKNQFRKIRKELKKPQTKHSIQNLFKSKIRFSVAFVFRIEKKFAKEITFRKRSFQDVLVAASLCVIPASVPKDRSINKTCNALNAEKTILKSERNN